VSLIGFGLDSAIEVASGAALLWRLHHDLDHSRRERVELTTLRIVGGCFLALALYILYESGSTLMGHETPERSIPGIIIAAVSVVVMPLLARAKRRIAAGIGSGAMHADSRQTDFCTFLSAILLGGLLLNALFGWWWADPAAAAASNHRHSICRPMLIGIADADWKSDRIGIDAAFDGIIRVRDVNRAIFTAATQVQRAVDYLHQLRPDQKTEAAWGGLTVSVLHYERANTSRGPMSWLSAAFSAAI
jgi:hypothetical protein